MDISTQVALNFPRARVFTAYRDRLHELLAYLPNIRGLDIKSRDEKDGVVKLVNHWKGGGEVPSVARGFLDESMLSWTDHATWKEAEHVCEWRTEVHAFPGALECSGRTSFEATSDTSTMIVFKGRLTCDATKVPKVPRFLAGTINSTVEKLFVGKIEENLRGVGQGIARLLAKE